MIINNHAFLKRRPLRPQPPPLPHDGSNSSLTAGMMDLRLNMLPTKILMTSKEENIVMTSMNGTRPYYFRRCKRTRLTHIESLPDEMLFKILLHLTVQDIYEAARFVCRNWYHIMSARFFVYTHLQCMTSGLLFKYNTCHHKYPIFISMQQGRIKTSQLNCKLGYSVLASCNGLVLEYSRRAANPLHLLNPATKQHFDLPPFFQKMSDLEFYGIACAATSSDYKVALLYTIPDDPSSYVRSHCACAILTVGVDKCWRQICTDHISATAREVFRFKPLNTEGYIHWASTYGTKVLTLNVETEIFTENHIPLLPQAYYDDEKTLKWFLSTGRYLSMIVSVEQFVWEAWEMKPESGEWRKLPNIIDLEAYKSRLYDQFGDNEAHHLRPEGWLEYPEMLVCYVHYRVSALIFYNLSTLEFDWIMISDPNFRLTPHKPSLVSVG